MSEKKVELTIEQCNECPYSDAMSVDCIAHAYCGKDNRELPADGKAGTEIMAMEIPEWCTLEDVA